ncbi:MAG: TolC family protein [Candidatus Omnitrophota bacterium]
MRRILFLFFISYILFTPFLLAWQVDTGKEERASQIEKTLFIASANQDKVLKIGLVDCILYALKNNTDILIKHIEPKLREDDVKKAKADFEPTLDVDYSLADKSVLSYSTLEGSAVSKSRDINANAGISGKIVTGAEYNVDFLTERYSSNSSFQEINPYYSAEPKITITQPLFRGAGIIVNKADIIIAQNNKLESEKNFTFTVMDIITKAMSAYYTYVFALENYNIDKLSLERAADLLEINKIRYNKGIISSVDLLETEAAVAQREKNLLATESAIKRAEDGLKFVTNLIDDPEVWNAKIELLDKPQFKKEDVDLFESLKGAFEYRPDYQAEVIDLKNRDIKIRVAKNALFPTLDLTGSFGLNGLSEDYKNAVQKIDSDYKDWGVGVKFSLPWGGSERADYSQKKLEKAQALISLKKLEQNIILEVRDKVRETKIQHRQVEVSEISHDKEAQNYKAQQERYASGHVSTHDMLDYQDKLSQTEIDYARALIDYNIALIDLDKAVGLTLVKNGIKLEE